MVLQVPEPILAAPSAVLPMTGVAYEAKWDGYRCLLARHPDGRVELNSRRGTALAVAFGDIASAALRDLPEEGVLLDGELVVWHEGRLAFDRLQRRMNRTAASAARETRSPRPLRRLRPAAPGGREPDDAALPAAARAWSGSSPRRDWGRRGPRAR
ncbi:hypothetical protein ACF082_36180 [Streptomyces lydicus]|uniref:ATP-dependent DNA ligase n=1 Tax=Streptomyces lydicus TaxID=47763 RepID=UPI0036FD8467